MTDAKKTTTVARTKVPAVVTMNPFERSREGLNAGTVQIEESRAVAEAMGKLMVAKKFPRDEALAYEKIIASCQRKGLAESSQYSYPRGGSKVTGPSIRLAEEIARNWGNIDYGIRELSQGETETEMEAYCWDLETNTMSSQKFTVKHKRDTKNGAVILTDQRDVYENNANMGARRLRARILAIIPPDVIEDAVDACVKTLAGAMGDVDAVKKRVDPMLKQFAKLQVTKEMIEKKLDKTVDKITAEDIVGLLSIYNSMNDGASKAADWFEGVIGSTPNNETGNQAADDINAKLV